MDYRRGDWVEVRGVQGETGVLRVWESHPHGLTLTSERGFERLLAGDEDAPQVGYPADDVLGPARSPRVRGHLRLERRVLQTEHGSRGDSSGA